jgi:Helix-turn-helix domain
MPRGRPDQNGLSQTPPANGTSKPDSTAWVTLRQFADELGVKPQALYWLRYRGQGPRWHRIGKELRARRHELDAWAESQ